eukprot:TRINITY_DN4695_c0_g1_i6.p1 TRINITY_DN4695_c0_g1~~TRINITY_DN4695_c0_g1_i6.p1  ORF type:complete len:936 (-),score=234.25 TRINITY_DN4695_c0_g1_i6:854-3661(-)
MDTYSVKVAWSSILSSKKKQLQIQKAISLVSDSISSQSYFPFGEIEFEMLPDTEDLFNKEYNVLFYNAQYDQTIFNVSPHWTAFPLMNLSPASTDGTEVMKTIIDYCGWERIGIMYCDSGPCDDIKDELYTMKDDIGIEFSASTANAPTSIDVEMALADRTRVLVVAGYPAYIQVALLRFYEYRSTFTPQLIFITYNCQAILEPSFLCDEECLKIVKKSLVGQICLTRSWYSNEEWMENVWNSATSEDSLSEEEKTESGLSNWQDTNMDADVPLFWDCINWVVDTAREHCIIPFLEDGVIESDLNRADVVSCYNSLFSDFSEPLSNQDFDGLIYHNHNDVEIALRLPVGIYGYDYAGNATEWHTVVPFDGRNKYLTNGMMSDFEWSHGFTTPPEDIVFSHWNTSLVFRGIFLVLAFVAAFVILLRASKLKSHGASILFGIMSRIDCILIASFTAILCLLELGVILVPIADDSFWEYACAGNVAIRSLYTLFPMIYCTISFQGFHSVICNRHLRKTKYLGWRLKNLLSVAITVILCVLLSCGFYASLGSDESFHISDVSILPSEDNKFESQRVCEFDNRFNSKARQELGVTFWSLMLIICLRNSWLAHDLLKNSKEFLVMSFRRKGIQAFRYASFFTSVGIMMMMIFQLAVSTEDLRSTSVSVFRLIIIFTFCFGYPLGFVCNELHFDHLNKRKESQKHKEARNGLIPKMNIRKNYSVTRYANNFKMQKDVPGLTRMMGGHNNGNMISSGCDLDSMSESLSQSSPCLSEHKPRALLKQNENDGDDDESSHSNSSDRENDKSSFEDPPPMLNYQEMTDLVRTLGKSIHNKSIVKQTPFNNFNDTSCNSSRISSPKQHLKSRPQIGFGMINGNEDESGGSSTRLSSGLSVKNADDDTSITVVSNVASNNNNTTTTTTTILIIPMMMPQLPNSRMNCLI